MKYRSVSKLSKVATALIALCVISATLMGCGKAERTSSMNNDIANGKIVVGFNKGVSQAEAEGLLKELGLKFIRTGDVNAGKVFFYKTGEKFIVSVPESKKLYWINKIKQEKSVYDAISYVDPSEALID